MAKQIKKECIMGKNGVATWSDPYVKLSIPQTVSDGKIQVVHWTRIQGNGVFSWKARIVNPGSAKTFFLGFAEYLPAQSAKGGIFVKVEGTVYKFETIRAGGTLKATELSGQDWTIERTFTIARTQGSCALFVDGALVATHHADDIPDNDLIRIFEILHTGAVANLSEIYCKDFGESEILEEM